MIISNCDFNMTTTLEYLSIQKEKKCTNSGERIIESVGVGDQDKETGSLVLP